MATVHILGRLERVRQLLHENDFDAVVAVLRENVQYLCGVDLDTTWLARNRVSFVLVPCDAEPTVVVDNFGVDLARRDSEIKDIRGYFEMKDDPVRTLASAINEKNLSNKKIGVELDYIPLSLYNRIRKAFPNAVLKNCEDVLEKCRMIKSEEEIKFLEYGAKASLRTLRVALGEAKLGDSEKMLAARILEEARRYTHDSVKVEVASGKQTLVIHSSGTDKPLEKGDPIKAHLSGRFLEGYRAEVNRAVVVGQPNSELRRIYASMMRAEEEVLDSIRPGLEAQKIYETFRRVYKEEGLPFIRTHTGHGLGLRTHEHPVLTVGNATPLEEKMVLSIDNTVRIPGKLNFGVHSTLLVTSDGYRLFMERDPELIIVG